MAISQIASFKSILLNGQAVTVSGNNRVEIGSQNATMLTSDSGAFASAANLASTGSQLYQDIGGLSGASNATFATITNLGATGQTLYQDLTAASGQFNINYAPALANYVYTTGYRAPVHFIGVANYTFTSGDSVLIATGSVSNTTGILPSAPAYSGTLFTFINGTLAPYQLSGIIGADTNPLIAPYDAVELYATSGGWYYVRQTGAAGLVNAITSLSGWAASAASLTTTGGTLYADLIGLSGA
jgi:hypothetical protein